MRSVAVACRTGDAGRPRRARGRVTFRTIAPNLFTVGGFLDPLPGRGTWPTESVRGIADIPARLPRRFLHATKGTLRMISKTLIATALAAAIAIPIAIASTDALAEGENEKCYGVAAAGKNDCQTATSSCAGTSTQDRAADAWIFVPAGTCEKIAGGVVKES